MIAWWWLVVELVVLWFLGFAWAVWAYKKGWDSCLVENYVQPRRPPFGQRVRELDEFIGDS